MVVVQCLWPTSVQHSSGPKTQMMQSSLGCQVGIWTSLVEDNVIRHRSCDGSVFPIVRSSPWGKKQELEQRRVKKQWDVLLDLLVQFSKDRVICRQCWRIVPVTWKPNYLAQAWDASGKKRHHFPLWKRSWLYNTSKQDIKSSDPLFTLCLFPISGFS